MRLCSEAPGCISRTHRPWHGLYLSPHLGPSRSVPLICADVQQAKAATSQQDALETAVKDLTVAVQRLSVCLFVCLLVCLPACLPVSLSVCLV